MPSLYELQSAVRARILDRAGTPMPPALAGLILPAGLSVARRLDVHRNNTLASLGAALEETYPVILRLVGAKFFAAAARSFVVSEPPREARLSHYGAGFAAFLAGFPPAAGLPYLPDVARLEWAVNAAFSAADAAPLDPARLAGLSPERSAALRFLLHPSCRLLESPYPIERIWRANQPGSDDAATIDLDSGGCRLLVNRDRLDVRFTDLSPGGFALLDALASGAAIADAYGAAAAEEPGFDLATALQRHIAVGLFVDILDGETAQ